jgi:hypothetical protein
MTTLEPFDLDPDDERLSRYLDGDLTAEEIVVLERDLAADPDLADRLAALRRISEWLALPPEPAELAGIDHAVERALHAYDEREPALSGPTEPEAEAPVAPVVPLRARQWWARPQLWTAAAALALVAAVAALAVRSDTGDDTSSETAAVAERSSGGSADADAVRRAEANDEEAGRAADAAADAASAATTTRQPASPLSLEYQSAPVVAAAQAVGAQDHADLDAFFDATSSELARANGQAGQAAPPTASVVPTTTAGVGPGPTSTPTTTTIPATTGSLSASTAGGACAVDYPNTATVGGRPVRWRVSGAEGPEQGVIEVVDAATCESLGSRPA